MNVVDAPPAPQTSGRTRQRELLAWLSLPQSFALALGLGVVIRLVAVWLLRGTPLADDAADYHLAAIQLAHGRLFDPAWPPGLPLLLAAVYVVLGPSIVAARLIMVGAYIATCLLMRTLLTGADNRAAATLLMFGFAVYPSWIFVSVAPLTQLPTAALLLTCLVLLRAVVRRPQAVRAGTAGLALAALVLVRPSNMLLAIGALVLLVRAARLRSWAVPALAVLCFAAPIAAWTAVASLGHGRLVVINEANAQNLFYGNNPWTPHYRTWWFGSHKAGEADVPGAYVSEHLRIVHSDPSARNGLFVSAALQHIRDQPRLFAIRTFSRIRTFFAFDVTAATALRTTAPTWLTAAVLGADILVYCSFLTGAILCGFIRAQLRPDERTLMDWSMAGVALYAVPYFVAFSHPTYHIPIAPLLAVPAGLFAGHALRSNSWTSAIAAPPRRALLVAVLASFAAIEIEWLADLVRRS